VISIQLASVANGNTSRSAGSRPADGITERCTVVGAIWRSSPAVEAAPSTPAFAPKKASRPALTPSARPDARSRRQAGLSNTHEPTPAAP